MWRYQYVRDTEEGNRGPGRLVLLPTAVSPSATWAVCTPSLETDFSSGKKQTRVGGDQVSCLSHTILVALQCPTPDVRVTQARLGASA